MRRRIIPSRGGNYKAPPPEVVQHIASQGKPPPLPVSMARKPRATELLQALQRHKPPPPLPEHLR